MSKRIRNNENVLIVMSHVKIGDFLLLVPFLKIIKAERKEKVRIVVPDILCSLLKDTLECYEPNEPLKFVGAQRILDLSFPLLQKLNLPEKHERLAKEHFEKFQYVGTSYAEALHEYFEEVPVHLELKPYLEIDPDEGFLRAYGLTPFSYFTVHAGSDFAPKNWPSENFEHSVLLIHELNPNLQCVGLVGPSDKSLFQEDRPSWFQNISVPLEGTAGLLAGSLFHLDNDSGVHHLAGALDVPSITVWGPTGPGTWHSLSSRNFIHWGGPNCAEHCAGSRMKECADRVCLTSVKPEELVRSAKQILSAYK